MLNRLLSFVAIANTFALTTSHALAAGDDWVKPASKIVEMLQSGFVQLGAGTVGVGIIIFGLYTTITGEGNWKRLGVMIIGGVLIFFGPDIATGLLEAAE